MVRSVVRQRLRHRVVVTTKAGPAFVGVLWQVDRRALVLREASAAGVGENGAPLPLDGEVIVLTADVAYIQRL